MKQFKTEQEEFWHGSFGDEYIARNQSAQLLASNIHFFSNIIDRTSKPASIIEFGCNIGMNLIALKNLLPEAELSGIEINVTACEKLKQLGNVHVYNESILDFKTDYQRDLVLIKTVLIHINPDHLPVVYQKLYEASQRYICIAEYYNPAPVTINYRGHENRLFKRDFAGDMLKKFPDLRLVGYGFAYHGDKNFPQDDITWFLLEKKNQL